MSARTALLLFALTVGCDNAKGDSGQVEDDVATDSDGDGTPDADDCAPDNASAYPGAVERCDEVDNDCDGDVDEDVTTTFYVDSDGDGYGASDGPAQACELPDGYASVADDCDDDSAADYPGANEVCDDVDNDCDGDVDEDVTTTFYEDADGDGYGAADSPMDACALPAGFVTGADDCDDGDDAISPGAEEVCDGADNNCDGDIDEDSAVDAPTWYADLDGDGYGDAASTRVVCDQTSDFVSDGTDCDDGEFTTHPGADELCDGVDNNCDGDVDEDSALDVSTWYADSDSDGYGDASTTDIDCVQPTGFVSDSADCDDAESTTYPGADELCDGVDNNCDGDVDEDSALDVSTWYADSDSDGFGDAAEAIAACDEPSGYTDDDTDCDDDDGSSYPGAAEVCDDADNDCDGVVDNDEELLGSDQDCPANDCLDVLDSRTSASDGRYWIDPTGGSAFEIFCDMTNDDGGWTLVANVDDVSDPYFGAQQTDPWEGPTLRNETTIPSLTTDVAVSTKYESWTSIDVTDVRVVHKNDDTYFLCEGLDVTDTLDAIFAMSPSRGTCSATCTTWSEDILTESTKSPVGLNCSDPNEGWISESSPTNAENARIGGLSSSNGCCVMNAFVGAAGDRGFSTSYLEKTWGDYANGQLSDDNIMIFVR